MVVATVVTSTESFSSDKGALLTFAQGNHDSGLGRMLQGPSLPNYTSPPLPDALALTPKLFQDEQVMKEAREAARTGTCNRTVHSCMIPFLPPLDAFAEDSPSLGVVLYGGGLVDPRSYSVLATRLAQRYGFAVYIPIFANDISFVPCNTGRLQVAQALMPSVRKWVLMGHSFGGTAAVVDLYAIKNQNNTESLDAIAGLVLLASDIGLVAGCGDIDFSGTSIPMALVTASNDQILNRTRAEDNRANVPVNDTFFLDILGGNHGGFGSYNASERVAILGPRQVDGPMLLDPVAQWDLSVAAAVHVASRSGVVFPEALPPSWATVTVLAVSKVLKKIFKK